MEEIMVTENEINNWDSPFTELFSLLMLSDDFKSKYTTQQLRSLYLHSENAIGAILRGIQDVGRITGVVENQGNVNTKNFGFFISALANLGEALNSLRSDAGFILRQSGVLDY